MYQEAGQEVSGDKVEEFQVSKEGKGTVRVNDQSPNEFRKNPLELFERTKAQVSEEEKGTVRENQMINKFRKDPLELFEKEEVQWGDERNRTVRVNNQLPWEFRKNPLELFKEFQDVFAWDDTELRGINPRRYQCKIPLRMNARPVSMQRHRKYPIYATKVIEKFDASLKAGFIAVMESSDWLLSIRVVPEENGNLRICGDFRKLNEQTSKDQFVLSFTNARLDQVAGNEVYSFLGYINFFRICMAELTEWVFNMYALTKNESTFCGDWKCQEGFQAIKAIISEKPFLSQRTSVEHQKHPEANLKKSATGAGKARRAAAESIVGTKGGPEKNKAVP